MTMPNRTLACTFSALTCGILGFWFGGQINLALQQRSCDTQPWGVRAACRMVVTPRAIWQGSTAGLWTGTILGAFLAASLTRPSQEISSSDPDSGIDLTALQAGETALSPAQDEAIRCLLALVTIQDENLQISPSEVNQVLKALRFSDGAIATAWRLFGATQEQGESED